MISIKDFLKADAPGLMKEVDSAGSGGVKKALSISKIQVGGPESVNEGAGSATRRAYEPWGKF